MRYVHRELESQVIVAARHFPALVLTGPRRSGKTFLLHFRDQQGLEVDFVLPGKGGAVRLVEAKAARTVTPGDAGPTQRLAAAWAERPGARQRIEQVLVHRPARAGVVSRAVAPGVQALPWQEFVTQGLA